MNGSAATSSAGGFGEGTVTLTRAFDAPPALVWQAWTDPIMMAQWFGPRHFTIPECALDVRVEERIGVDPDVVHPAEPGRKTEFPLPLDLTPPLQKRSIAGEALELVQAFEIARPLRADCLGDE